MILNSTREQWVSLKERCPCLCPSIFPSCYSPNQIKELYEDGLNPFPALSRFSDDRVAFVTNVDIDDGEVVISEIKKVDEVDAVLYDISKVMKMMIGQPNEEISVYISRFLEVNEHGDLSLAQGRALFYEVYNLAYSLRVIIRFDGCISNIDGLTVKLGGVRLPIGSNEDMEKVHKYLSIGVKRLSSPLSKSAAKQSAVESGTNSDDNSSSSEEEEKIHKKKKRRGKRGKSNI